MITQAQLRAINKERALKQAFCRFYKEVMGCAECGTHEEAILEFHHILSKRNSIGRACASHSLQYLFDEIRRCIVLCANCHARRTIADKRKNSNNI